MSLGRPWPPGRPLKVCGGRGVFRPLGIVQPGEDGHGSAKVGDVVIERGPQVLLLEGLDPPFDAAVTFGLATNLANWDTVATSSMMARLLGIGNREPRTLTEYRAALVADSTTDRLGARLSRAPIPSAIETAAEQAGRQAGRQEGRMFMHRQRWTELPLLPHSGYCAVAR